jgi:hypothetical protein
MGSRRGKKGTATGADGATRSEKARKRLESALAKAEGTATKRRRQLDEATAEVTALRAGLAALDGPAPEPKADPAAAAPTASAPTRRARAAAAAPRATRARRATPSTKSARSADSAKPADSVKTAGDGTPTTRRARTAKAGAAVPAAKPTTRRRGPRKPADAGGGAGAA